MTWLLELLKRAWAWIVKHPKLAAAAAVVSALAIQAARILRLRRKVARAEAGEARARVEGEAAVLEHKAADAQAQLDAATSSAAAHQEADRAALESAEEIARRRRERAARYRVEILLLAAVLAWKSVELATAAEPLMVYPRDPLLQPGEAQTCPDAGDNSGLEATLRAIAAERLAGVDRLAVIEAADDLKDARDERARLCKSIAEKAGTIADLEKALAAARALVEVKDAAAAGYETAWREALAKSAQVRRSGRWNCTAGGGPGAPVDDLNDWRLFVGVTCGVRIWPN